MPRVPVNYDPGEPSLRPAQSVLPIPYAPMLPRAAALPFEQLAGLSGTLAKISLQQKERQNEAELEIGRKLGNDAGDDLIDQLAAAHKNMGEVEYQKQLNQAAFLNAEKKGDITPAQNEWRTVGFTQSAARRVMSKYESDLIAAQQQATAVVDKDGNPTPAKPVEQVIQETWSKYKDNPFFQDYYGAKESNGLKVAIDSRYRQDAANKLAGNMAKEYQDNTANEFSRWATTQFQKGATDEETLANFSKIANEHRLQGVDVAKAAMDGFRVAAANAAAADDGSGLSHASTLLRLVQNAKVGNLTIGEDARTGPEIKDLIQHYDNEATRLKQIKLAGMEAEEQLHARQAASNMDQALSAAKAAQGAFGFPPVAQSAEMDRYINQYEAEQKGGEHTRADIQYLRQIQRSVFAGDSDAKVEEILGALNRSKDAAKAQDLLDAELARGTISSGDFRKAQAGINEFRKVEPLLDSPSAKATASRLASAASTPGLPTGAGESWQREAADKIAEFNTAQAQEARKVAGLPEAERSDHMDAWNKEHGDALTAQLRAGADGMRTKYVDTVNTIVGFSNKLQQIPEELLTLDNGLAPEQIGQWKAKNRENADRRANQVDRNNAAFNRTIELLKTAVLSSAKGQNLEVADQAGLAIALETDTRRSLLGIYDAATAAATDPSKIEEDFNKRVLDYTDKRSKEILGNKASEWVPYFRPVAEGGKGKTAEEAITAVTSDRNNVAAADRIRSMPSTNREALAKEMVAPMVADPNVPKDVAKVVESYHTGAGTGLWGLFSPNTVDDARVAIYDGSNAVLRRTDLKDTERQDAITNMHAAVGIPAESLLKGSITLALPPSHVKALEKLAFEYRQITGYSPDTSRAFEMSHPEYYAQRKQARDIIDTYLKAPAPESPIRDNTVNLYTTKMFKDNAELKNWFDNRRDDLRAIAEKHGMPTTDQSLQRLFDAQLELNTRSDQLAR